MWIYSVSDILASTCIYALKRFVCPARLDFAEQRLDLSLRGCLALGYLCAIPPTSVVLRCGLLIASYACSSHRRQFGRARLGYATVPVKVEQDEGKCSHAVGHHTHPRRGEESLVDSTRSSEWQPEAPQEITSKRSSRGQSRQVC